MNPKRIRSEEQDDQSFSQRAKDIVADRGIEAVSHVSGQVLGRLTGKANYARPEDLIVNVPRSVGIFGFGRKVVVPPNQIHVVSASGIHSATAKGQTGVYGSAAVIEDNKRAPAIYWRNALTQVIGLSTVTFLVPVSGAGNIGIEVYDSKNTPFNVVAHVVASLDVKKPEVAAAKVGGDVRGLIGTIEEVTQSQLLASAAKMTLDEVIENRHKLAADARQAVEAELGDLGYVLALLTIETVTGEAFDLYVTQARTAVVRDTTVEINTAELATETSNKERQRIQAMLDAETRTDTEQKRLTAEQAVARLALENEEALRKQQHQLALLDIERAKEGAEADHSKELRRIELEKAAAQRNLELAQAFELAESAKVALVAAANLKSDKELAEAAVKADAARQKLVQDEALKRDHEKALAEADRKKAEEVATADRARQVQLTHVQADAEALRLKTKAETEASLTRATAEADSAKVEAQATKERAAAAKDEAEATRAKEAATGLAQQDVEAKKVANASEQVKVDRERGLAQAEVDQKTAEAKIALEEGLQRVRLEAERVLAQLYNTQPALLEIRLEEMRYSHDLEVARINAEAQRAIFEALAQRMDLKFHVFGGGDGQISKVMTQIMTLGQGLNLVGQEVPAVQRILDRIGTDAPTETGSKNESSGGFAEMIAGFGPYVQEAIRDMNPRVLSSLSVEDLVTRVGAVVSGKEDLMVTLDKLRQDANFQVVSKLPVAPILKALGMTPGGDITDAAVVN